MKNDERVTTSSTHPYLYVFQLLRKPNFISRFSGIFFLLLFTLSVTPKRFLHDALANHRDSEHDVPRNFQELYASGFQCHADDLVVEAPFLPEPATLFSIVIPSSAFGYASPLYHQTARPVPASGVRGPPVFAVS